MGVLDDFVAARDGAPRNAGPEPAAPTGRPADFARTYGAAARRAGAALGIDPSLPLGQWGLETGWGRSVVPGTHNLGNIKDFSGAGVAATDNATGSRDKYRAFANPDEFADHYVDLIKRKYPQALGLGSDAARFGAALRSGGYAEDPGYADKVAAAARMFPAQASAAPEPATAEPAAQPAPAARPQPSGAAFSQGLRAGGLGASAGLRGLAGQLGEGVSRFARQYDLPTLRNAAAAFTANQRAAAVQDEQAGAQAMEGVPTRIADVRSLRDLGRYGAGMLGQSVPLMGAGIVGGGAAALAAPELAGAALLGATAATAPQMIGAQYNAQQADPVQAAQPYGLRTGMGAGVGTVQAGLMNVVPQMMGGRLFGRAAEHAVAQPFGKALAANTAEAVGGNATAGVAASAVGQQGASLLHPQRDTSGDAAELGESAAGGALLGLPFAGLGTLGSMRGNPANSVIQSVREQARRPQSAAERTGGVTDVSPTLGERAKDAAAGVADAARSAADTVRGVFGRKQEEQALHDIAGGDTDGVKTLDPHAYGTASPAAREAMRARAEQTRLEQVQQAAQELWNDQALSPASREALAAMGNDFSSAANRMAVASMALAQRGAKTAMAAVDELSRWADAQRARHAEHPASGAPQEAPPLQSGFSPEITQAVKDVVTPYLEEKNPALLQNPDAINKLADNLRAVMMFMTDARPSEERPPLPEHVLGHLQRVFGGAAPRVLHALTNALSPDDVHLMRNVNELGRVASLGAQRARTVADVLGEDTVAHYHLRQDELQTLGDALAKHADGSAYRDLGRDDAAFQQRHFEDTLREQFGDDTAKKLLISAAKDAQERSRASSLVDDRAPNDDGGDGLTSQHAGLDSDLSGEDILGGGHDLGDGERIESGLERSGAHGDQLADQFEPTTYHGEGGDNKLVRTTAAWRAHAEKMVAEGKNYDLTKDAPSVRLYRDLQRGVGRDRNVEFVPFKELPPDLRQAHIDRIRASTDEHMAKGMTREQAEAKAVALHGDPNEVGLFRIDGMKQEGRLSKEDLDKILVDTSLPGHKDNPSRIITGKLGHSIDALRLVDRFQKKVPWNRTDERGSEYRLAHVFMEGIAAVQDHLQRSFDIPDETVVRLGRLDSATGVRSNGLTWGALKKLGMMPHDAGRGGDAFSDFLHHATPDELRAELAHQKDLIARQEAAEAGVRERIDDMKRRRQYFDKNIVRQMYADARVDGARDAPFHIQRLEQAVEDIGKQPLVERIDSSDPKIQGDDMAARQDGGLPGGELFNRTETVQGHDVVKDKDGEWVPRPNGRYREAEAATHGMQRELDPLGQVHVARDGAQYDDKPWNGPTSGGAEAYNDPARPTPLSAKEDKLVVKTDLAGDPINHRGATRDREGPVVRAGREIDAKIVAMETAKSETGRALGRKARALDDFYDSVDLQAKGNEEIKRLHDRFRAELRAAVGSGDVAAMINSQHAKLAERIAQVPGKPAAKADPFVTQALAGGQSTDKVIARVASSTNAEGMAGALKTLLAHPEQNAHSTRVVQALNERIGQLAHDDPSAAYNLLRRSGEGSEDSAAQPSRQRAQNPAAPTAATRADVEQHIQHVLGPRVAVAWRNLLHAGDYRRVRDVAGNPLDLIRLSLHSLDPMSTAFHETLHAFQQRMRDADLHGVNQALYKAADSIVMRGKLEKLLANEPDALRQIRENSPRATEERAAYLYQFYHTRDAAGNRLLALNEAPKSVVEKIGQFIRHVLGIWSNDERAMHIMDYLHGGEYARNLNDRNAVARALLERGTNPYLEGVKKATAPLTKIATSVLAGGHAALADLNNPAINTILKKLYSPGISQDTDAGWIVAQRSERTAVLNGLMTELARRNTTAEQLQQAMQQLQTGVPASTPEARLLAHRSGPIRQMLDKMHAYMTTAGVKLGDLGVGKDYFPVVYDTSYIASHANEWRAMLDKYVRRGDLTAAAADRITAKLMTNEGNTFGATDMPGMAHIRERKLDFLDPQDRAPFLQKDMIATLNSYVSQATRRAEWARRFGADNAGLDALKLEAVKRHGATPAQLAQLERYIEGVNGTLGDDIAPGLRRIFGNAIVYQNLRLLPMAVFSMAVDPMGIMVRGGTLKEAWGAFQRGATEIPRGFSKNPKADPMHDLSKLMGTIDDAALVHTLGTGFSQGMVGDTGRRINDTFFKYNLVEQMNTSMRVAALPAAINFMARHAAGENAHSTRYLAELGLTKDDVIVPPGADRPLLTKDEFRAHGMNDADATAAALKMRLATNKWVDGAVLRPNQAQKPTWMNDPHYALMAHLKQFVYAFHDTILKRTLHEAEHGNYTPALALASYVPIMMAADFMKGALLGGGSQPDYKADWGLADWIGAGMQRAGLFSVGQFGIDALKDLRYGGTGIGPMVGPMLEQAGDALRVLGGREGVAPFLGDALPASAVAKAIGHFGDSKADPTFVD